MKNILYTLSAVLFACQLQASAIETGDLHVTIDNLGYELNTKTKEAHVVSYGCSVPKGTTILVIPEEVEYNGMIYRVTALRDIGDVTSKIETLYIPSSISYIGRSCFNDFCTLQEIHISDLSAWCRIEFQGAPLFYVPRLFLNEDEITDLVIPEDVTSISANAFYGMKNLRSVSFPEGLEIIGDRAFHACSQLKTLTFPSTLKEICYWAFGSCDGLESVYFSGGNITLGDWAFSDCDNLSSIIIKGNISSMTSGQFRILPMIKDFYCYAEVPPAANSSTFESSPVEKATLHVPQIAVDSYRKSPCWENFGNIVKIEGTPDGIENLSPTPSPSRNGGELYDLQGRRLMKAPEKGLYIQDGHILVK